MQRDGKHDTGKPFHDHLPHKLVTWRRSSGHHLVAAPAAHPPTHQEQNAADAGHAWSFRDPRSTRVQIAVDCPIAHNLARFFFRGANWVTADGWNLADRLPRSRFLASFSGRSGCRADPVRRQSRESDRFVCGMSAKRNMTITGMIARGRGRSRIGPSRMQAQAIAW
jgi:hypothetical protein